MNKNTNMEALAREQENMKSDRFTPQRIREEENARRINALERRVLILERMVAALRGEGGAK